MGAVEKNRKKHKDYYVEWKDHRCGNGRKMNFAKLYRFMDAHIGRNANTAFQRPVYYRGRNTRARRNYFRKQRQMKYDAIYNEALVRDKEKLKKEKELNIITRDRLGFDANSFVNNPKETYDKETRVSTST